MYQWLFKKNGFQVAQNILYFNGKKNEEMFNNQLNFDVHLIRLDCSTSWVENKIIDTVNLLRSDIFPNPHQTASIVIVEKTLAIINFLILLKKYFIFMEN